MAIDPQRLTSPLPIVIDMGKQRRKKLKDLKRGEGTLMLEVNEVLDEVRNRLGVESTGKQLVPVVLLYRKQPRKKRRGGLPLPFMPPFMP